MRSSCFEHCGVAVGLGSQNWTLLAPQMAEEVKSRIDREEQVMGRRKNLFLFRLFPAGVSGLPALSPFWIPFLIWLSLLCLLPLSFLLLLLYWPQIWIK